MRGSIFLFIKSITQNKYFYIFLLIAFSIASHINWFVPKTTISWGDWYFWHNETAVELYKTWGTWLNQTSLGSTNIQIPFLVFMSIWSFFIGLGSSFDTASKITLLIPIALLSFLSPFFLFSHLIKKPFIAFTAALFYGTTTYGLFIQPPIQFVYALSPLVLLAFIQALEKNTLPRWLVFLIIYCIGLSYEVRIMVIVSLMLGIYLLCFYGVYIKKYFRNLLIISLFLIGLNIYWILPTLLGGATQEIDLLTSRIVFGDNLFTLPHAFTVFNWLWTGGYPNKEFARQPIIFYFWIFPVLSFIPFLLRSKISDKRYIIYFGLIALLGIFLTKQSSIPFQSFYSWAYDHLPGFNLYRESSKFYLITSIGYAGLIAYLLKLLNVSKDSMKRKASLFVSFIIIVLALFNAKPLITQEIGTLFVSRSIPVEYITFKNFILSQDESFKTLWVPYFSRWSMFSAKNPELSIINLINSSWSSIIEKNEEKPEGKIAGDLLKSKIANKLLDSSSIKYVVIPLQDIENDDDFFQYYGKDRQYYIDELDKLDYLKKIDIGTEEIVVYENSDFRPHIYLSDSSSVLISSPLENISIGSSTQEPRTKFEFINPTEYRVKLGNISNPVYLQFAESYHPDWKLRAGDFNWFDVLIQDNYFLSDKNHFENDAKLNSFYVDPKLVCKVDKVSKVYKEGCRRSDDGGYDITMTLYFKPQSYMYLGMIISGVTLVGILGYFIYVFLKFVKRKELIK